MSNTTESTDALTETRTLIVRVGTPESAFDALDKRFAALDAGDHPEPLFELVLQREKDLQHLLNPRIIRLIRMVARQKPSSIRETARLVERDVNRVNHDLHELERINIIDFEQDGRAKRPTVWYDDIEIELPVSTQSE